MAHSKPHLMILDRTLPNHPLAIKLYYSPCHILHDVSFYAATPKPGYDMACPCYSKNVLTATWW